MYVSGQKGAEGGIKIARGGLHASRDEDVRTRGGSRLPPRHVRHPRSCARLDADAGAPASVAIRAKVSMQ
jgi:hypothetical protein